MTHILAKNGFRRAVFAAAMMAALATPAAAQRWFCNLQMSDQQLGWIPPDIIIDKAGDGTFVVQDGLMQSYGVDSVKPKVVEDTDARIVLRWSVDATSSTGQIIRMAYRATIFRDTNKIRLYGNDGAYANDFEGRGTCKVQ